MSTVHPDDVHKLQEEINAVIHKYRRGGSLNTLVICYETVGYVEDTQVFTNGYFNLIGSPAACLGVVQNTRNELEAYLRGGEAQ